MRRKARRIRGARSVAIGAWLAVPLFASPAAPAGAETTVTGVEDGVRENVLAYLDVDDLGCAAGPTVIAGAIGRIRDQTAESLRPLGYYAPRITISRNDTDECFGVAIGIEPGERVRLREVDLRVTGQAAEHDDFTALRSQSPLVPGAPLNHGEYEAFKRGLLDLARNRGFAEARFEASRLDIYPDELAADVTLRFESGPRYAIGEVTTNQTELETEFVNSYHELDPGTPYDNRLLTMAFLDLNDSGYFASVDVRSMPPDPESLTIPIEIDLVPAPRRLVSYGVGFSTDTGPRLRFSRQVRRFNERGHQLMLDARLSPVVSEFTSIYRMPFSDPRIDWLSFSLGAKRQETDTALARSIEGGVRRVIDRNRGWSLTQFLSYIVEDFRIGTQTGRPHLLIPGADWTRIRGDDALRPANGAKLSIELRGADDALLSDTGFVQTTIAIKWIRSLSARGRLLLRGRAGYLAEDDFERLPPSVRFFAGGDVSIRGFDFESLGPVDLDGNVIGGDRLFEASVEYEHEVRPRWSIALFADSGNAFDKQGLDLRTGAGLGARWRSPLGPVRIDLAWPVNDPEHGVQLHVSLGPDL